MKGCPPASRNFLSDSWFDSWVGQRCQNQQAASTNSFKVYNASIKNTTSSQGHPKSSFVAKGLSPLHNMCKLDGLYTLGHFWRGRVLPRGGACHHVIVVFLFVFFFDPTQKVQPPFGLWQTVASGTLTIHHQGGWHEKALGQFHSATHHKLESHSFRSVMSTNLSAPIFALISLATGCADHFSKGDSSVQWLAVGCGGIDQNEHTKTKHLRRLVFLCSTTKINWSNYSSCKFWSVRSWIRNLQ